MNDDIFNNNDATEQPQRSAPSPEKLKALQVAMDKIDKTYGRGSIMKLGDENIENVEVIPTVRLQRTGRGWIPQGTHHRDLWPRVER